MTQATKGYSLLHSAVVILITKLIMTSVYATKHDTCIRYTVTRSACFFLFIYFYLFIYLFIFIYLLLSFATRYYFAVDTYIYETSSRNAKSSSPQCIVAEGVQYTVPSSIATAMNNFASIGKILANKISSVVGSASSTPVIAQSVFQLNETD